MKIVLAEDDIFLQKFYSLKLTEKGYEVIVASDGQEALKKIKEIKPQILLLDLVMPNKDGFQVLLEKAQDPTIAKLPVLVFSTLGQEADIQKAKDLGASDYVNKSTFDLDNLIAKITTLTQSKTI